MYHADPLVCRQCGGKLKVVVYVSDEISVKRILTALGLNSPEDEKPHRSARWSGCRWTMKAGRSRPVGIAPSMLTLSPQGG